MNQSPQDNLLDFVVGFVVVALILVTVFILINALT
jgi:hypothetical protein